MRINRREFIRHVINSGLLCCSGVMFAEVLHGSNSKNNKIIDVHHHILPDVYTSALAEIGITSTNGRPFPNWSAQRAIETMDRNGIKAAVTSISAPGIYFGDLEFTKHLSRKCNEYTASLIANHPGRFGGFCVLPLPDVDASLNELSYALDTLKLDGVILLSNYNGDYLGSQHFSDVFTELDRRQTVVFIHPTEPADKLYPQMPIPPSFFEFVFDTTRTVASLVQHNTLQRFPNIRFIVAHSGGTAPYLVKKMGLTAQISGQQSEQAISQLRKIYYDTALSASRYPLELIKDLAGVGHIVFGSDYGFAPEFMLASSLYDLNNCEVFQQSELRRIYGSNALELFPRLASG